MPTYTQEYRFLAIKTELDKDKLLLRSFTGHEGISSLFHFQLDMLSEDQNVDYKKLIGKDVTFTMLKRDNETERYFNGYISHFTQLPSEGRFYRYQAEIVPWLWFLTRTSDCRLFQNKTVVDIVQEIFHDYGFSDFKIDKLQGTYTPWELCTQYRETAYNFVARILEQEGIFYYFHHENGKHTLILGDKPASHLVCDNPTLVYDQGTRPDWDREEDTVCAWNSGHNFRPGKVALNEYYFETPLASLISNVNTVIEHNNDKLEIYDYPGEYEKKDEGEAWSKLRMEEAEAAHAVITGESYARSFESGCKFTLTKHFRDDENKEYVLTSVTHTAHESTQFETGKGQTELVYNNHFTCIPASVPFRPPRITPKPVMQGTQTAIVTGKSGEEIWSDKYGRIKVQFHWDRRGKRDENSSPWIRVSQLWAGKKWGTIFIPRIGQEVIVDFLEGDPDRPIVIGTVYNASSMPPYTLPDEQTKMAIKSYSSKGGGGFNEIRFEDKKGSEQIFIHGEYDYDLRVKHDRKEYILNEDHLVIAQDRLSESRADHHIKVTGDQNEKVDGTVSLQAGADMQEKVGGSYALDTAKAVHIKAGMTVVIEAGTGITFKVGSNFITIDSSGIAIKGIPAVQINSAGAALQGAGSSPTSPKKATEASDADPGQAVDAIPEPIPPAPGFNPQAVALQRAAAAGMPFCDT